MLKLFLVLFCSSIIFSCSNSGSHGSTVNETDSTPDSETSDQITVLDGDDVSDTETEIEPDTEADIEPDSEIINSWDTGFRNEKEKNLFTLCKIWGFLKYYHTVSAKGEIDIDEKLFEMLPFTESPDFFKKVENWISAFGKLNPPAEEQLVPENVKLAPDIEWIKDNSFIPENISKQLTEVLEAERNIYNYYIKYEANFSFSNEKLYEEADNLTPELKLLGLFRFWNAVEYFFPYKYLIKKDWDFVLKQYLPEIIDSTTELEYLLSLTALIIEMEDTHANIYGNEPALAEFFGKYNTAFELKIIEEKAVVYFTYSDIDPDILIKKGDVILEIDGVSAEKVLQEKLKYSSASNQAAKYRKAAYLMTGTNKESLTLKIEREGKEMLINVKTFNSSQLSNKLYFKDIPSNKIIDDEIGYIYCGSLKDGEFTELLEKFKNMKGLILDLRCYPSFSIFFEAGNFLMPHKTEFAKYSLGKIDYPGYFTMDNSMYAGEENEDYYKGKVVALIDEITQSNGEFTAMVIRAVPNATIIGSTTAGADGNIIEMYLPGKIKTIFTGLGIYNPDGSDTQQIGIIPDIYLRPTIAGLKQGRDEVLEKAVEIINNSSN